MENLCYLNIFQICQGNYEIEESKRQSKRNFINKMKYASLIFKKLGILSKEIFIMFKKDININKIFLLTCKLFMVFTVTAS